MLEPISTTLLKYLTLFLLQQSRAIMLLKVSDTDIIHVSFCFNLDQIKLVNS